MLFALPDDSPSGNAAPQGDEALSAENLLKDKKEYDAMAKVELDLEDAPFLEEEKAPPQLTKEESFQREIPEAAPEGEQGEKKEPRLKKLLRPKIIIPVVVLVALAVGALFYFLRASKPEEPPAPPVSAVQEPETPAEPQAPPEYTISFDPFWVEQTDVNGNTRFLIFKFAASTGDEKVQWEANQKTLLLRDAVFYYLSHKNLTFLSDKDNAAVMKRDILGILNGQLSLGALKDLLIESYLVK